MWSIFFHFCLFIESFLLFSSCVERVCSRAKGQSTEVCVYCVCVDERYATMTLERKRIWYGEREREWYAKHFLMIQMVELTDRKKKVARKYVQRSITASYNQKERKKRRKRGMNRNKEPA